MHTVRTHVPLHQDDVRLIVACCVELDVHQVVCFELISRIQERLQDPAINQAAKEPSMSENSGPQVGGGPG